MDINQNQKLFPSGIQGNSAFKNSKMSMDSQIDNGILSQLGTSGINGQSLQVGANGMYGSMNTTLINSQNIGSGNQNSNQNQPGSIGSGSKTQQILGLTAANGNQYGNLVGNINPSNSSFMSFSYQILDNGLTGLGGNLAANGQQQGKQAGTNQNNFNSNANAQQINFNGMGINKNDNLVINSDAAKGLFQNGFKNILGPQQSQNMLIESAQNFLVNRNAQGGVGFDSIQLQSCDQGAQGQKMMYQEMMKNSGNQLDNSHNFSNSKQNQMQSSQNSLNNGLNSFLGGQNNPSSYVLYNDQQQTQQQQKLLLLQQQQQQQQILLQDQIKQPNLIQLQQLGKLNNLSNNPNSNQQTNPSNKGKSLANEILNDISDVDSEPDDKQKQLIEANFNTNPMNDFLSQMRDFYNNDQTQETDKKQKKDNISAKKQEHLQLYIQNMVTKFQGSIETHLRNCQKIVEAISQVQASTAFIQNNTTSEGNTMHGSNESGDKNKLNNKQMSNYDKVFETWECINETVEKSMEKIEQTLKLSLEDTIWNFHIAFNSQQINEKKQKLTIFAAKKIFDEKYEFSQSNNEISRSLDVLIQSKYDKSAQGQQQDNFIKNIIDQSSDYIFNIIEEPLTQSLYLGYVHKLSKTKKGRGILISSDNNIYQGYFENNKPQGQGRIIYASCNLYEGNFEYGLQHGKGKYMWSNGNVYEGSFEKGRRSGRGKFSWKDGRTYEGYCTNDVANGFGEYTNCIYSSHKNSNNPYCFEIYRGNWKNNKMDGKGILFVGVQAEWKENQLVNINQMITS